MIVKFRLKDEDFNINKILESGQNSKYKKNSDIYKIILNNKEILITTKNEITSFNIDTDFFNKYLYTYFDMNTNYKEIRYNINKYFPELELYTEFGKGLRFINQPFIEAATTFIISQNNNIKRINSSTDRLVELYGTNGIFPTLEQLKKISINEFRNLGVGFRDKYLYYFFQNIDKFKIEKLKEMNTKEAFEFLNTYNGIGPKVANCILLFGLQKRDVFPVDTHIRKIMQELYFDNKDIPLKEIENFALKKFGKYSSYIQQYMFYYIITPK